MISHPISLVPVKSTFLFCSILVLLSALIFVSSKSTDGTISGLDYVMVVLVIGIVALSSLYFLWVLLIEMYRSVAFYRKVLRKRSREKKARSDGAPDNGNEDSKTQLSDIVIQERAVSTGSSDGSWQNNPQVLSSNTEKRRREVKVDGSTDATSTLGDDRLRGLSSFNTSQGSKRIQGTGARRTGTGIPTVKQRATRFGGKEKRKKNFTIAPSRVDQETKGTDVVPSMILHDDDAFHTNPDSVLGNTLRMLNRKTSATVDDDEQRSAAAQRSPMHRTSSGQRSSMYGEEDSD